MILDGEIEKAGSTCYPVDLR